MRIFLSLVLGLGLVVGASGAATAGTINFSGSLSFGLATLPAVTLPGSGVATVNGSGGLGAIGTLAVPGVFGPAGSSLPVTANMTVQSVRFTGLGNAPGTFTGLTSAPGGGQAGLTGRARVCVIFKTCAAAVNVPLTPTGATGFGFGGQQTITGTLGLTLQHNPWTVGAVPITIHNPATSVTTPALPAGFGGSAVGSGTIQLVSVTKAFTSLTSAFPELPVFAVLNLHFVPEPGTLLLLGSGVAGLAILGRTRRKR